jgi:hypothetical protein
MAMASVATMGMDIGVSIDDENLLYESNGIFAANQTISFMLY